MQIGLRFGDRFRALADAWGSWIANEFEALITTLQQWSAVEHNDDGTHGVVTATSITTPYGTFSIDATVRDLIFNKLSPASGTGPRICATSTGLYYIGNTSGQYWNNQANSLNLMELTNAGALGLIQTAGTIRERARTTPMGEWITFTPTRTAATGTWTAGTVQTAKYMLIGKTMFVDLLIDASSNSNITAYVAITVPGGFSLANIQQDNISLYDLAVDVADGTVVTTAGGNTFVFNRANGANIAVNALTLYIRAQFHVEIQ